MALTAEQQAVLDEISANFESFMTALSDALEADNDRDTPLNVAEEKRTTLRNAASIFSQNNLSGFIRTAREPSTYLLRSGGGAHDVDGISVNDPAYLIPRL